VVYLQLDKKNIGSRTSERRGAKMAEVSNDADGLFLSIPNTKKRDALKTLSAERRSKKRKKECPSKMEPGQP